MHLISNLRKISVVLVIAATASLLSGCVVFEYIGQQINDRWDKEDQQEQEKEFERKNEQRRKEAFKELQKRDDEKDKDSLMVDRDERPEGEPVELFNTGNIQGVQNGGTPARFTLDKKYYITKLGTYHWHNGQGTPPGTIGIKAADGKMYGPWKAELDQKVYWIAKPDVYIPAGSYTVVDSDPSTLARNAESGGEGMAWASGIPAK